MRDSRKLALGLAIAMVLALGGTQAGAVFGRGGGASQPEAPDAPGLRLQESAEAAGALGLYFDDLTGEYVVVGPIGFRSDFSPSEASAGVKARVEERGITATTIEEATNALEAIARTPGLQGKGYSFGFDPKSGKILLKSSMPEAVFASVLRAFPGAISFTEEDAGYVDLSRSSDIQPYWGGTRISVEANWNDFPCSAGFSVHRAVNNKNYMVSAGHCADTLFNQFVQPSGKVEGVVRFKSDPTIDSRDLLLIGDKTYAGHIYTTPDATSQAPSRSVISAANPLVGSSYCFSGAKTFKHCSHTATNTDFTLCYVPPHAVYCLNHMAVFVGGTWPQLGDSGGPVYFDNGNEFIYARGIIIAKKDDNTEFYAHKWSTISGTYGVSIIAGYP